MLLFSFSVFSMALSGDSKGAQSENIKLNRLEDLLFIQLDVDFKFDVLMTQNRYVLCPMQALLSSLMTLILHYGVLII
jgi:hypothetical protein